MKFKKRKLKEVCDRITVGFVGSMTSEYRDDGIPFLRSQNIQPFYLDLEKIKYVSKDFHEKISKSRLTPGDVAVVRTGYPGTACVIPNYLKDANCADLVVITPSKELHPYYLTAVFNSAWGIATVSGNLVGVAQQHFNVTTAKELEIPLPEYSTQQKIASILSAFDDLIENNTRRLAILEEMARLIYREWFVHYRYPGHENDRLVDSGTELGEVPEGWEVKSLEDLCELIVGQSPKSEFYNGTGDGLPFHQGVKDFGNRFPTTTTWCTVQKRIAEKGDILFSVRAPVGRINIANCKMIIGRGLHAIRSKSGNQVFIFEHLKDKFQEEDSMGSGTIYKSVTKGDMLGLKFKYPGKNLIEQFEEKAEPIFDQIRILTEKNIYLKETRDLLLPKLISGKVGV